MEEKMMRFLIRGANLGNEDIEVYQYGLKLLLKKTSHIFLFLVIALICGEFWSMLIFLVVYASMREYSGGYHAKSEVGCYLCTILVTVTAILIFKVLHHGMVMVLWLWMGMIFCGIGIWLLSPLEVENRPLESEEKIIYRKITHKYEIIFGLISLLGFWWSIIVHGIAVAWAVQMVMLLRELLRKKQLADVIEKRI